MRLSSLTLQGFKSFGNRTTIEIAPGVTAIIGPNGSGKSNVIDALRWTTGGGRASEFRATDKTDLIFHGAAGKRSVGLAEVELELTGDDGSVKLYRSLDREGNTRLRLNGRAARFLDVEEALAGSGLGRSGLAIIGQGEVSQVLMADPAKLLEYVAEAAGVARLSGRREQTQARLDTALGHLDRLQDVLLELEARCRALEDEAAGARRHAELSAEALRLRYTAALARQRSLVAEIAGLSERRGLLEAGLLEGRERLTRLRERGQNANTERDTAEERFRAAAAELEFRRGNLRLAAERLDRLRERVEAHAARVAALEDEARRLADMEPPTEPDTDPAQTEEAAAAAQENASVARAALAAAAADESAARAEAERARVALAEAERAAAGVESQRAALLAQAERVEEQLAELNAEGGVADLEALAARAEAAAEELSVATADLDEARGRLQQLHERQAMARAEAVARRRAAERLRAALEARRGYAQGPRNALSAGIAGVIGSVADLVRVPERFQGAISGALGRRSEYVVVDRAQTAQRVLAHVRRAGGFVTVLPLDLLRVQPGRGLGPLANQPGVIAAATDVIEHDPRYSSLFEQLLGGTAVVEDMEAATALARRFDNRPRMVTLEGDTLEATGAMSGGQRSQHASVLGAAAELEEAEGAAQEADEAARRADEAFAAQQADVRARLEGVSRLETARDEATRAFAQARERRAGHARLVADLEARKEQLERDRHELDLQDAPDAARLAELTGQAEAAAATLTTAAQGLDAARAAESDARLAAADAQQAHALATERWRTFEEARVRFRTSHERAEELRSELQGLTGRGEELEREATEATAARDLAAAAVPDGLEAEEAALAKARDALREVESGLARETQAQADRAQELEDVKLQSARRETALELAQEELGVFPPGIEPLDLSERAARSRLRDAETELEALGAVNHRAATDLAEATERKESLEAEAVQATLAVSELQGALERIDKETTSRLNAALARLSDAFASHVRQLFGGDGRGAIEVDAEGARPVGVRIRLQPPGKQTQSLHLLSVGERTMGALAFLFALMGDDASGGSGGGLPVAVLDEVDAPLDEANIRRFCSFVSRLAEEGTQFVLITHQKATFEVADALWGVTTEQGVSRVFSIRREGAPEPVVTGA